MEKTFGLHVAYSNVNQAWFVMWEHEVLRVFNTREEAEADMAQRLRITEAEIVRHEGRS